MQTYELLVRNRAVVPNSRDMTLVRTSVGIDQVHVMFDNPEWLDFPVRITFAQGEDVVSQTLVLSEVEDSDEWVAESTVTVPYEVIDMVGPIRVTFQGTDADGRHIITAKGAPLSVEEAGDVVGVEPADVPTVSQWEQAYSDAMAAAAAAQTLVDSLQSQLATIVADAEAAIDAEVAEVVQPATTSTLGMVIVGDGLSVTEDGTISTDLSSVSGMTPAQVSTLRNLALLAQYTFDTSFDEDGVLQPDAKVKASALPFLNADEMEF